jgi:hypothetical protein
LATNDTDTQHVACQFGLLLSDILVALFSQLEFVFGTKDFVAITQDPLCLFGSVGSKVRRNIGTIIHKDFSHFYLLHWCSFFSSVVFKNIYKIVDFDVLISLFDRFVAHCKCSKISSIFSVPK